MKKNPTARMFRASQAELDIIDKAIEESGLTDSTWIRAMLLAAAGHLTLSEQLRRAHAEGERTRPAKPPRQKSTRPPK